MDYKSRRWLDLRERVLRRDGYQCRECRRYGKRTEARVVHHVWPAALYPDFRWSAWNLVALCAACHDAMHVRRGEELSDAGRAWQRRVRPPERREC